MIPLPDKCFLCWEPPVGVAHGYALCEQHFNEAGFGIVTVPPYEYVSTTGAHATDRSDGEFRGEPQSGIARVDT